MFTRRTATVTISSPEASIARLVSAKSLYFPVPTLSRDRYSLPASTNGSFIYPRPGLATADEMHNLDRIARLQATIGVFVTGNNVTVHFNRNAPPAET